MSANTPGQISPDGAYYWNGSQWVTTLSPDGAHRWNGTHWAPVAAGPPPPQPIQFSSPAPIPALAGPSAPPSAPPASPAPPWLSMEPPGSAPNAAAISAPAMPAGLPLPPGYTGRAVPPGYAAAPQARGLGWQFGGSAAWSMGFGLASILAPLFTTFYFPILPIFGLWRAVIAFRAGRVGGAALGVILNILGGIMSLLASGLLH